MELPIPLGLALVGAALPVSAQERPEDVSALLEEIRAEHGLPALVATVVSSEATLAEGVAGVRDVTSDVRATLEDLWHVGSVTKSFTSTLAAVLVEEGVLAWEDELGDRFPPAEGTPYASVTVAQLASHTAGIVPNPPPAWFLEVRASPLSLRDQRAEAVASFLEQEPTSAPGTGFLYSNAGYMTLGAVLEHATDTAWEELLRAKVLEPLGLETAGFGPPGAREEIDQPRGHARGDGGELVPVLPPEADNPAALGPAGTLHMSVHDLARYLQEHLRGERGTDGLLEARTCRMLHRGGLGDYAMGWLDMDEGIVEGERVVWHNGSNTLWYAMAGFVPGRDRAFAVVSNGSIHSQVGVHAAVGALIERFCSPLEEVEAAEAATEAATDEGG